MSKVNDVVNSPNHYTAGNIETIDYIKDVLTPNEFERHCIATVIKYISRYPYKNGIEDLQKAKVYLNWAIETLEEKCNEI